MLKKDLILTHLQDHPWGGLLQVFDTVDSTNTLARALAAEGAPSGTVILADEQTGGRGRLGRTFDSQRGKGLYFSLILRPKLPPEKLLHITPMVAVAACEAIQTVTGVRPRVKWINDLILRERKLAGILTESSVNFETGLVDYLVIGIGINCSHAPSDFPTELNAISLRMAGLEASREHLAAALIRSLSAMADGVTTGKALWMKQYAADCLTVGRKVRIILNGNETPAYALGIDSDGGLVVRYEDGSEGVVSYGEVSVRGVDGYI